MVDEEKLKPEEKNEIELLESYIKSIQYGSVTIHIQDGKIIQIEKNEKIRFIS